MSLVHPVRNPIQVVVEQTRVHVQRHGSRSVTEHPLHRLYVGSRTDSKRSRRMQVFTINLEAHRLQMVLQGAQNPEGPASIGAPPDEIKSLVADTITAARTLESESDKANPCTAPGASADCVTILFDFARAMTAMQAQFAAWSPYGG